MSDALQIRWASADETPTILNFIEAMGFNPRDEITWNGLEMVAMSAWQNGNLIGVIPLEPRPLRVGAGRTVWAMHETVVAVHPAHRACGIGSAMQEKAVASLPGEIELLSVFREEPQSAAYRWYLKNGFLSAMHIESWFYEVTREWQFPEIDTYSPTESRTPWDLLDQVWCKARETGSGFVDQGRRPLQSWLSMHPYRHRYDFTIAVERGRQGRAPGYAILGAGDMHSQSKRCDILELLSTGGPGDVNHLLTQITHWAANQKCQSIRWPLAQNDPNILVAQELGFVKKWGFDMLVRPLQHSSFSIQKSSFDSYASIDYI